MRFLGNEAEGRKIMPLNFIYDNPYGEGDDILMILYKDINTGEKFVKNIVNPEIYIHVVKKCYRCRPEDAAPGVDKDLCLDGSYRPDFFQKEQCDDILTPYRRRKSAAAKALGIKYEEVDTSPYVSGTDIDVRHWYFIEFLHEYANDLPKELHVGYFDIETDATGVLLSEVSQYTGKMPITCVTYISDFHKQVYTFVLNCPDFGGMDKIINQTDEMYADLHRRYDAEFGVFDYRIVVFNREIDLIASFWMLIKKLEDDLMLAWNAPFDVSNLIYRIAELGYDPTSIIADKRFQRPVIQFKEDRATFVAHKKNHVMNLPIPCITDDHMRIYSGVRSGREKLPSTKLDAIAEREEIGHKVRYPGTLMEFMKSDFPLFVIYNIHDVMLEVGINRKVNDTGDIYGRMITSGILNTDVFSSTTTWAQYIKKDLEENKGMYLANNKNKFTAPTAEIVEYGFDSNPDDEFEDEDDEDLQEILEGIADKQALIDKKTGKKKKFSGAHVQDTRRTKSTGVIIDGMKADLVHRYAIDGDITAEYPTAMSISNSSNDTFVGKVYMDNDDDINLPFYSQYNFLDNEEAVSYKMNKAALAMETALQGDYMLAGEIALGLPGITELEQLVLELDPTLAEE